MAFVYINPSSDQSVVNGFDFFRLNQCLVSAGDIFESPQGAHAFALGPDSDISRATIAYIDPNARAPYSSQDPQIQTNVATLTVSPQRPFASFIPTQNKETQYQPSQVPGRVLIWPTEIYDATWLPPSFDPAQDKLIYEPPVIDIIQFFKPPPTLTPQRTDKTYYYDQLRFGIDDCFVMIPFYGRRYASIQMINKSTDDNCAVTISGVNFRISPTVALPVDYYTFTLGFSENQSRVITSNYDSRLTAAVTTSATAGLFDYLLLRFNPAAVGVVPVNIVLRVVVSDSVAG